MLPQPVQVVLLVELLLVSLVPHKLLVLMITNVTIAQPPKLTL